MKDKDLVKLLLETIQELYDSPTNKTIVDYKDYEWFISLQDIKQLDIKNKYIQLIVLVHFLLYKLINIVPILIEILK